MPATRFLPSSPLHAWYIILGFLLASGAVRLLATPYAVWIDEAEQVYLSQWFRPGAYDAQPPLYTWIHYLVFRLAGPNLVFIIGFKFALVIVTYWMYLKTFIAVTGKSSVLGLWGMLSLAFIFQLWDASLLSTNTLLVTFASVTSIYLIIRITQRPGWTLYVLLGLALGVGFLSKYNFVLAVLAMLVAGLSLPAIRKVILSPYLIVTVLACLVITFPHLLWIVKNQLTIQSTLQNELGNQQKLESTASLLQGAGSFGKSLFSFIGIWCITVFIFFKKSISKRRGVENDTWKDFFTRYIVIILVLILLSALTFEIRVFHERYFQPFLIFIPLVTFLYLDPVPLISSRVARWFQWLCISVFVLIFCLNSLPFITDPHFGKTGYMHIPYDRIAERVLHQKRDADLIITNSILFAGNLKLNLSNREKVLVWNDRDHFENERLQSTGALLYVWQEGDEFVPEMLASLKRADSSFDLSEVKSFEIDYHLPPGKKMLIHMWRSGYK